MEMIEKETTQTVDSTVKTESKKVSFIEKYFKQMEENRKKFVEDFLKKHGIKTDKKV